MCEIATCIFLDAWKDAQGAILSPAHREVADMMLHDGLEVITALCYRMMFRDSLVSLSPASRI